jgi:hypothetical protein
MYTTIVYQWTTNILIAPICPELSIISISS